MFYVVDVGLHWIDGGWFKFYFVISLSCYVTAVGSRGEVNVIRYEIETVCDPMVLSRRRTRFIFFRRAVVWLAQPGEGNRRKLQLQGAVEALMYACESRKSG